MSLSSTVADDQRVSATPDVVDHPSDWVELRAHIWIVGGDCLHPAVRDRARPRSLGSPAFRPRLVAHRNVAVRRSLLLHPGSAMGQSRVAQRGRHGGRLSDCRDDGAYRSQGRDPRQRPRVAWSTPARLNTHRQRIGPRPGRGLPASDQPDGQAASLVGLRPGIADQLCSTGPLLQTGGA